MEGSPRSDGGEDMETHYKERIADLIGQLKIKNRDLEFANRVIDKDKHKKECKRVRSLPFPPATDPPRSF